MPAPIPYAGGTLDRLGERRSEAELVAETLADPRSRAVVVGDHGVLVDGPVELTGPDPWALTGDGPRIRAARVPLDGRTLVGTGDDGAPLLLGVDTDGIALFVADATPDEQLADLRAAAAVLAAEDAGLLAYASTMRHWHAVHRFCGQCGRPNVSGDAGHVRRCPEKHEVHPRTDPVVIMLVTDGRDRVLLGRQPSWPPNRWSSLAGFVEPGESLETAVAREVAEEAGVLVGNVRYVATQPWPFPASLMIGCEAEYRSGDAHVVDAELEAVRWFTRDEIAAAAAGDPDAVLLLPPSIAIARHLLDRWLAG